MSCDILDEKCVSPVKECASCGADTCQKHSGPLMRVVIGHYTLKLGEERRLCIVCQDLPIGTLRVLLLYMDLKVPTGTLPTDYDEAYYEEDERIGRGMRSLAGG